MAKNDNITISDLYKLMKDSAEINASLHKQLKEELKSLKEDLSKQVTQLQQDNSDLSEANKKLSSQLKSIERKQKKYNIVVYGVQGEESKTVDSILNIINHKLNISCTEHNIRDIFRIGNQTSEDPRPVVVEFINYRLKIEVLKNAGKLKSSGILVEHDYIIEDYQNRKFLRHQLKKAKEADPEAKIKKNLLIYNNNQYSVSQLKENCIEQILGEKEKQHPRRLQRGRERKGSEAEAGQSASRNCSSTRPKKK